MSISSQIARRDFSSTTLRTLQRRGIKIVSVQMLPGSGAMPWANAERGYLVNQGGSGKVMTFAQVLEAAK